MDQLVLMVLPDSSAEWMAVRAPLIFLTDSIALISSHNLEHFYQSQRYLGQQRATTEFKQIWRLGVLSVACSVCI